MLGRAGGEGYWEEVEEGKGGINGDDRDLTWGDDHTIQCTDDVL